MNIKSINSKLDFLENLIVEMNPVNLEELKNICISKITEIHSEVNKKQISSQKLAPQSLSDLKDMVEYFEFEIVRENHFEFVFMYNGSKIIYYKKKNWFSGKQIKDGRGAENLIAQLRR